MDKNKSFTDEMLKKYIESEVSIINEKRKNKENWKKNEEYNSQITIRKEGDNNVYKVTNGKF